VLAAWVSLTLTSPRPLRFVVLRTPALRERYPADVVRFYVGTCAPAGSLTLRARPSDSARARGPRPTFKLRRSYAKLTANMAAPQNAITERSFRPVVRTYPTSRAARAALTLALPALCSGCLLLGNPCGSKSDGEEYLNLKEEVIGDELATMQDDGTYLVPAMDCSELCRSVAGRSTDSELLDLDSCELRLHPVMEDPPSISYSGNREDWTRVDSIEIPVTLPAEWNSTNTLVIAECSGTYRTECKN
jgi:hypothetical protein